MRQVCRLVEYCCGVMVVALFGTRSAAPPVARVQTAVAFLHQHTSITQPCLATRRHRSDIHIAPISPLQ